MRAVFALALILAIDMFLFLGQTAVDDINPGGNTLYNRGIISGFDEGNYTLPAAQTPDTSSGVSSEDGTNIFTDTYNAIKGAVNGVTAPLNYVKDIILAPYSFLEGIGTPREFNYAVGAFWFGLTTFVVASFFFGRE